MLQFQSVELLLANNGTKLDVDDQQSLLLIYLGDLGFSFRDIVKETSIKEKNIDNTDGAYDKGIHFRKLYSIPCFIANILVYGKMTNITSLNVEWTTLKHIYIINRACLQEGHVQTCGFAQMKLKNKHI